MDPVPEASRWKASQKRRPACAAGLLYFGTFPFGWYKGVRKYFLSGQSLSLSTIDHLDTFPSATNRKMHRIPMKILDNDSHKCLTGQGLGIRNGENLIKARPAGSKRPAFKLK